MIKCKRRFMHGKRRRRSPLRNEQLATRPLTDDEKKKLEGNMGTAPNRAGSLSKALKVGDEIADATIESKKEEAKHGVTGRKI